ncbi:MAG: response regulator [Oligoflexales bacterium]
MISNLKKPQDALFVYIDPSAAIRAVAREVAHEVGFQNVQVDDSPASFLNSAGCHEAAWVVTGTYDSQDVTGFHILRYFLKAKPNERSRVSILFDEEEQEYIPYAYALGMFSHHKKPITKASLLEDFGQIMESVKEGKQETDIASDYFRRHLRDAERFPDLVVLEDGLIRNFSKTKLYLSKADAHFRNGSVEEGRLALAQLLKTDPDLKDKAAQMMLQYTGVDKVDEKDFTIDTAIIIDSDGQAAGIVKQVLTELSAKKIEYFEDGESALSWIKENRESLENASGSALIIMEWKIPRVPGPILLQNIRMNGLHEAPVIVLSSLVKESDQVLLSEVGVERVVEKPIDTKKLITAIIDTIKTAGAPRTIHDTARKTRALLKSGKIDEARRVASSILQDITAPKGDRFVIEAEFLFVDRKYEEARELLMKAIKEQGQNVHNLNLLGKCLMALRDFDNATNCFQKAQKMSPNNIERLCQIAESASEAGDSETAKNYVQNAAKLSQDSDIVGETVAKIALNDGDLEEAANLISGMESAHSIVSFINNQAVACSKMEKFEESVSCYRKALKAIPDEHKHVRPVIEYNLALTLIKMSEQDQALECLKKVVGFGKSKVLMKAKNLKARLLAAIEDGKVFQLRTAATTETVKLDLSDFDVTLRADFSPGDYCLYGIYHNLQDPPLSMKKFFTA